MTTVSPEQIEITEAAARIAASTHLSMPQAQDALLQTWSWGAPPLPPKKGWLGPVLVGLYGTGAFLLGLLIGVAM